MEDDNRKGLTGRPGHLRPVDPSGQMVPYDPYLFAAEDEDFVDLREYWRILVKRRWIIFSVVGIILAATLLSTLLMKPVYKSTASVLIKNDVSQILGYDDFESNVTGFRASEEYYTTQYEILRSDSLAADVIRELGIRDHPQLTGEASQRSLFGGIVSIIGALRDLFDWGGEDQSEQSPMQKAVNIFHEHLSVEPVPDSRLVNISYTSFDPEFSARVAGAVVNQYIFGTMDRRMEAGEQARQFLEKQLQNMRIALEQSDQALMEFARESGIANLENSIAMAEAGLVKFNERLNAIQAEMVTYATYRELIENGETEHLTPIRQSETIQMLQEELSRARTQYAAMSQRFKPSYPSMVALQTRIDELEAQIEAEEQRIVQDILGHYQNLQAQAESLKAAIEEREDQILALNQRAVQYNILQREYQANKELYNGILQRMKEIGVAAGVQENNIAVIDEARAPLAPFKPDLILNMVLALVLGLVGGAGLALLLEFLDSTVRRPEDLERISGRPVLGLIPLVSMRERKKAERRLKQPERQVGHYCAQHPGSAISEAFRSLRTSLMFSTPEGAPRILAITSPGPGDGKTTTSLNLSTVMAQHGSRVLLIDADLRKPRLHRDFKLPKTPGLTDRIAGYQPGEGEPSTIQKTDVEGLSVMCSGTRAPNPAELLSSDQMKQVLANCGKVFDYIVIDSAPVLGLADAMILSQLSDGMLLVTSAGQTGKDNLKAAIKRLTQVRAPLHGLVLNAVNLESPEYNYYSTYYYGYSDEPREPKVSLPKHAASR